jgi:hypothetical protein
MKFLLLLSLLITFGLYSQTIYFEDFSNDWKKGAITYGGVSPSQPTDGNWSYVIVGSPDNDGGSASSWNDMAFMDGAAVMSTNGSTSSTLAFRWNDVNNGSSSNRVDWYSSTFTGKYVNISISIDYGIGNGGSSNTIYVYYIKDGATEVLFGSSVNQSSTTGTFTINNLSCSTSFQLYVKVITRDYNSSYVYIDNVTITGSQALPIDLSFFGVKQVSNYNLIEWTTSGEIDNDYFTVEESLDGGMFNVLGYLKGSGNSSVNKHYEMIDDVIEDGVCYYRLRQTDFNGDNKVYDVISIMNHENVECEVISMVNILGQPVDEYYKGLVIITHSNGLKIKTFR